MPRSNIKVTVFKKKKNGRCGGIGVSQTQLVSLPFPKQSLFFFMTPRKRTIETLWEKEKMMLTSIFPYSHHISCPIRELKLYVTNVEFFVCRYFRFEGLFGKGLQTKQDLCSWTIPGFCLIVDLESNTTSDWLNHLVSNSSNLYCTIRTFYDPE